jgi:hypothetical protein
LQLPHAALAELYQVDRSTVTRAIGEIRPLLAARGFAVPGEPGIRLRTLADVFAYAAARGTELRIDGTEVQVRRPRAHKAGRRAFVSGKKKMNTAKASVITDGQGRTLWAGAFRPGRMHDQTALRTEGIAGLFRQYPQVKAKVDARSSPARSRPRRSSRRRTPPRKTPQLTRPSAISSHRSGSASSTPTPSTSNGGPSSGTSDDASTSARPTPPSPAWFPTAPPSGNPSKTPHQASTTQH